MRRGLDGIATFSLISLATACGYKSDRHKGGTNDQLHDVIKSFEQDNYINIKGEMSGATYSDVTINTEKISNECDTATFAIIYLDEYRRISKYKQDTKIDNTINQSVVLLVFSYLRMVIPRRKNQPSSSESHLSINERRKSYPEAFACFYTDIADKLGISVRSVTKSIAILEDLDLIHIKTLPRVMSRKMQWLTCSTVFSNTYKREYNFLLASGKEYYEQEVQNKIIKMKTTRNK